ncbi:hypothetical protein [Enterobacter asburiae]|uniref:hypothetical protein n=1 Tax=Enterobacter asburiae TaxID=61645 RepID=UPI003B26C6EE
MKRFEGSSAPWSVIDDHPEKACFDIHGVHGDIYITVYRIDENRASHNAHLIAAAPDLLKELQNLRDYVINVCDVDEEDCHIEHPLMSSRAAISKALGEE